GVHRVECLRSAHRRSEVCLEYGRQTLRELMPGRTAVGRLEDPAARAAEGAALDEALLLLPERGVDRVRIARIDPDVVGARVFVLVENLLKGLATVGGSKDTALLVRSVGMAEGGDEEPIRILRVDGDHRDHLRVVQAEVRPRLAGVGRFIHAVTDGEVGTNYACAAADVDDVRVGGGDGDGADRAGALVIEERVPGRAVVGGAPDAAVIEADVRDVRLAGDS